MADRKNSVLVVDDEPLIRLALVMAFEEQGFQVVEAGNVLLLPTSICPAD